MILRCQNCGGEVSVQIEGVKYVAYCYRPHCAYQIEGEGE
jgi:hypothetical protein